MNPIYLKRTWKKWIKHAVACRCCITSGFLRCPKGDRLWAAHVARYGNPPCFPRRRKCRWCGKATEHANRECTREACLKARKIQFRKRG